MLLWWLCGVELLMEGVSKMDTPLSIPSALGETHGVPFYVGIYWTFPAFLCVTFCSVSTTFFMVALLCNICIWGRSLFCVTFLPSFLCVTFRVTFGLFLFLLSRHFSSFLGSTRSLPVRYRVNKLFSPRALSCLQTHFSGPFLTIFARL